jgi:hypothetical protein
VNQFIAAKPKGAGPNSPDPAPPQAPGVPQLENACPPGDAYPARRAARAKRPRDTEVLEHMIEYLERLPPKQVKRILRLLERMT